MLLEANNSLIQGIRGKITASASVYYSAHSRRRMREAIRNFQPEMLHVHNWFPVLSPSIILEADTSGVPIVQTLHNFRMICANALLFRKGVVCTDCMGKSLPLNGVVHACYRGSYVGSAIVTTAYAFHRLMRTWDRVNLFISVSSYEREILIRGGMPAEKIVVKPNFVSSDTWRAERNPEDAALFVGRLAVEKGIGTLLAAWNSGKIQLRLKIIGDGPMANEVRSCAACNPAVEYLGSLPPDAVYGAMASAKFLVFPSEWFETFGRTVIEAFSQGTPVLAADLGCVRELVEDGVTGYRYSPGNVDALIAGTHCFPSGGEYERMRANCRELYLNKYTADINYPLLMDVYERAIAARKAHMRDG
jgi:glycosyltransferase involved in cell wall biosynthesis